jgi:mRNA interferase RelE/StbE
MSWKLEYSKKARKQLHKLNAVQRAIILSWMEKHINGCENPRAYGKGLVGNHAGEWRYRIGDYRVLCEIQNSKLVVLAFSVEHRRSVYN